MSRIPDEDIQRIKRETDIVALIQSRGVKLTKQGANWIGFCPFHKDTKTPNLIVTPAKGLFRCMASGCGKAGNAIQFVQWHDGISFRHAFELLRNGGSAAFESASPVQRSTKTKLKNPLHKDMQPQDMLEAVIDFYHANFDAVTRDFLLLRGFHPERVDEMAKKFKLGNADRMLGLRVPNNRTEEGSMIRSKLTETGI